ncbi:carbon dioxide concentrating mechanism protein CcmN [Calothrix sp. NIES-4071]|nr:carbon dioxide concentrating mechanism protein CcmN [Calothrix sp. NIES-4071]BAZ61562.1 carbon dioxide concentrating mechanism protein CcmN [Calothrix sp. NIES-4105]
MSVPPLLRFGSSFESYIGGEVIVHESAVIAPGVILNAAPDSKIIIGAGVCIGMGSVIQVDTGTLEIEAGASIGAGFLMVGEGKIGANACIGSATTVFRCSVAASSVVAPGSILGDKSRNTIDIEKDLSSQPTSTQPSSSEASLNSTQSMQQELEDVWAPGSNSNSNNSNLNHNTNNGYNSSSTINQPSQSSIQPQPTTEQNTFGTQIAGQTSIQRLLVTLFPHRQALNKPLLDDDESE